MTSVSSFFPLPVKTGQYPFRLGTPSYVYPTDIAPNVEALGPAVDDVEVVLYESDGASPCPRPAVIERLAELAAKYQLTYTIHFPIDLELGSPSSAERQLLRKIMVDIIRGTHPLKPLAYVLHLEGIEPIPTASEIQAWQERVATEIPALVAEVEEPGLICVENLDYDYTWCDPILDRFGLGCCMDFGHLWGRGGDIYKHWQTYRSRIRVAHFHGYKSGQDHLRLSVLAPETLKRAAALFQTYHGVVTLELFSFEDVNSSLESLKQAFKNQKTA